MLSQLKHKIDLGNSPARSDPMAALKKLSNKNFVEKVPKEVVEKDTAKQIVKVL